jgi:RNA 3'-terminal phosphate cyclase (ATP)
MIEIDGSFGEGGGQILRSALSLSVITGKPFRLRNIRAKRKPKPGLQPQHLASVRAAATIGSAKIAGDSIGSSVLTFEPGAVVPGKHRFAIGTAGATGLVLHTVYLPLAWQTTGPSEIILEGGTHVSTSPCFHFLDTAWRAFMAKIGIRIRLEMTRPGFYPRGGGQVIAHVQPCSAIQEIHLSKCAPIAKAVGFSAFAGLPDHVAKRQARRTIERLKRANIEAEIETQEWPGGPGSVVGITFEETPIPTFFFGLGERGKPAESVADEAADQAIAFAKSGAPVDSHIADQLILPLALSTGTSEFRVQTITKHLTTNIAVIKMFIDRHIECGSEEGNSGVVTIGE